MSRRGLCDWAFAFLKEGAAFRAGRLYQTPCNAKSDVNCFIVFVYPGALYKMPWHAEPQYKYRSVS